MNQRILLAAILVASIQLIQAIPHTTATQSCPGRIPVTRGLNAQQQAMLQARQDERKKELQIKLIRKAFARKQHAAQSRANAYPLSLLALAQNMGNDLLKVASGPEADDMEVFTYCKWNPFMEILKHEVKTDRTDDLGPGLQLARVLLSMGPKIVLTQAQKSELQ